MITNLLVIGASVAVPVLFVWACQEEVRFADEQARAREASRGSGRKPAPHG